jgi:peptide deformylase
MTEKDIKKLNKQIEKMVKFLEEKKGVGLAAPQIGIYERYFIWQHRGGKLFMAINPTVLGGKKKVKLIEGCLSYPNRRFFTERYKRINVFYWVIEDNKFVKKTKNLYGMEAIVFQHENDHLDGITIASIP